MAYKALFTSKGTIRAIAETPRAGKERGTAVTAFGPATKQGEQFETLASVKGMKKAIEELPLAKLRIKKEKQAYCLCSVARNARAARPTRPKRR